MCLTLETKLSNHAFKDPGCDAICTSGVYRGWSLCKQAQWFLQMVSGQSGCQGCEISGGISWCLGRRRTAKQKNTLSSTMTDSTETEKSMQQLSWVMLDNLGTDLVSILHTLNMSRGLCACSATIVGNDTASHHSRDVTTTPSLYCNDIHFDDATRIGRRLNWCDRIFINPIRRTASALVACLTHSVISFSRTTEERNTRIQCDVIHITRVLCKTIGECWCQVVIL